MDLYAVRLTCVYNLKVGCFHPVACTRSGSGFPSNARPKHVAVTE
jgi:hypothetical protein